MEFILLLRLIMAHLLGDFLLQPTSWVEAKAEKKEKSPQLYYHVLVVTLLSYIAIGDWHNWYLPLIIFITHLCIDIWKSYRPNNFIYFIADQGLHLAVILLIWLIFFFDWLTVSAWINRHIQSSHLWELAIGYYLVTGPLGIAIGSATSKWQKAAGMNADGLDKAGMWIGRCERILVMTFIVLNQYTALGFLMAAKSILRFGDKEAHQQKKTEYILVGTLISFASAAAIGAIVSYLMTK